MDITRVVPVPTPVRLAGRTALVPPLRLADVATLQGWLRDVAAPCPLDAARPGIEGAVGAARRKLLAGAYDACEGWPVRYGSAEGRGSSPPRPALFFLAVALARAAPRDACDPEELLHALSPAEWRALLAACWGSDPLDELERLIDPEGAPAAGDDLNWGEAFAELAKETGWTFGEIAELTIPQWIALRTGGKVTRGAAVPPGMSLMEFARRRHALFYGDDGEARADA